MGGVVASVLRACLILALYSSMFCGHILISTRVLSSILFWMVKSVPSGVKSPGTKGQAQVN